MRNRRKREERGGEGRWEKGQRGGENNGTGKKEGVGKARESGSREGTGMAHLHLSTKLPANCVEIP